MFDHLDDPEPFVPGPALLAAAKRRGRARRRRTWLARGGLGVVGAVVAVGVASAAVVDRHLDDVERVEVAALAPEPEAPADPYTVLVVGTDGRAPGDPSADDVTGSRTDTIVVARVHPAEDRITVLPLPRDLWVEVPGTGGARLNTAYATGGPSRLLATLEADLGIEVHRYVELDFAGTVAIGDALGGLRLRFPSEVSDAATGFSVPAGCHELDGTATLALARSRRLQYRGADGTWRRDPTSDLGRIERQQAIATALLSAFSHLDTGSPRALAELVGTVGRELVVDSGTTNAELVDLFRDIAGSEVVQRRLPVVDVERPDGAMVLERGPGVDEVLAALRAPDGTEPTPGSTGSTTAPTATTRPHGEPTQPAAPGAPAVPPELVLTPC